MGHIIIIIIICLQFEVLYVAQIDLKPRFNCIFLRVALGITTTDTETVCNALILYNFNKLQSVSHCIRWCALIA